VRVISKPWLNNIGCVPSSVPTRKKWPRHGTPMRHAFDLFYTNKGVVLNGSLREMPRTKHHHETYIVSRLIDDYGFNIRRVGERQWQFAGEWINKTYVDYTQ